MKRSCMIFVMCASLIAGMALRAPAQAVTVVTAQILDYENGFVFFTTGDGFRVAQNVSTINLRSGNTETPAAREYARVTFDAAGTVTKLELSHSKLPPEGDLATMRRFAVALSTPAPNPDLAPHTGGGSDRCASVLPGKSVSLNITIQVPVTTPINDTVYMTTDQSGWNPQAYRLDRRDALHYHTVLRLLSGTRLRVLFDRGSAQTMQAGEGGIERDPYQICIGDEDAQTFAPPPIPRWTDQLGTTSLPVPGTMPTPYNPNPFPGFPTPPPVPTPTPGP
jgi:hypothetical protein